MREKPPIEALIARIAGRQHGHVTRQQLLGLSLSPRAIDARVTAGRLIRVHNGVYAVAYRQLAPIAIAHAAVLACRRDAVLSCASAEALWGWRRWPAIPEVTAPHHRRRPGITTHRTTTLLGGDVTTHYGIPVTTAARTIFDTASRRTDAQIARAVNDARRNGHLPEHQLRRLLDRSRRIGQLIEPDQAPTRSVLEDAFVAFLKRYRLPMPRLNAMLRGFEVDGLYEAEKLVIELDSWKFHGDQTAFEHDRERDAILRTFGYDTHRITVSRLNAEEARRLAQILASRSSTS